MQQACASFNIAAFEKKNMEKMQIAIHFMQNSISSRAISLRIIGFHKNPRDKLMKSFLALFHLKFHSTVSLHQY